MTNVRLGRLPLAWGLSKKTLCRAMIEKQIEKRLTEMVKERGGLCLKFTAPGMRGAPDRIVITPEGRVIFVELKTVSGRLSKIQERVIRKLRECNADVRTLKGLNDVKRFIREVMPK